MNYQKHYDYCCAHPVKSFMYMMFVCFVAVWVGRCLHIPRPIYIVAAISAYYALTGGLR